MNYIQEFKKNNLTSFNSFYESSKKSVFYSIYLIVKSVDITEDLMQETYMSFLENVQKLKDNDEPIAWLVRVAKNKAINYYNKNKRDHEYLNCLQNFSYSTDRYIDTGLMEKIKKCLSEKEYEVFLLHVLGEYSFKEISKFLSIPIGTLTWMYQESRKKLQLELGGKDNDK